MQVNRKSAWVLAAVLLASSHAMAAKYLVVINNKEGNTDKPTALGIYNDTINNATETLKFNAIK